MAVVLLGSPDPAACPYTQNQEVSYGRVMAEAPGKPGVMVTLS